MKSSHFITLIAFAMIFSGASDVALAQSSDRGSRGSWWGGGDSTLGLLQDEKIREDLELVDDQVEEFKVLRDEMYQGMREMWSGMRGLDREERRAKFEEMRSEMESRRQEMEERVGDVLLPHQRKRLDQLSMQSQARRQGGTLQFVGSDKLAEKLGLTEEQQNELKEKAEEARKDLEKKISQLRKKAEDKVLSVLTSEQRKQYKEIMGESFKFEERNRWGNWSRRDRGDRSAENSDSKDDRSSQ